MFTAVTRRWRCIPQEFHRLVLRPYEQSLWKPPSLMLLKCCFDGKEDINRAIGFTASMFGTIIECMSQQDSVFSIREKARRAKRAKFNIFSFRSMNVEYFGSEYTFTVLELTRAHFSTPSFSLIRLFSRVPTHTHTHVQI